MNRWKVKRKTKMFYIGVGEWRFEARWCVTSPTGVDRNSCATYSEAISYADKMARTVEVELPRATVHFQLANQSSVYMLSTGGASITKHAYQSQVGIPRADLEPFALALLAHHYRNQP